MNKPALKVVLVLTALVVCAFLAWAAIHNSLVNAREEVKGGWGQVENAYQRRADLIPNLVETVRGYAAHEKETLEEVTRARAAATAVKVGPENMTPEAQKQFLESQGQLSAALGRLLMVTESYPDLKANQGFLKLQDQLEGTENRIASERRKLQEETTRYNALRQRFPNSFVAGFHGFEPIEYYRADTPGANEAPKVNFR